MKNKILHSELKRALEAELEKITGLSVSTGADRAPVSLDQKSVGCLSGMDEGAYGFCLECGDEIAEGRLKADTTVARCVARAGAPGR